MWDLYQRGELNGTRLTGRHRPSEQRVSTERVLSLIAMRTTTNVAAARPLV